MSWSSVIGQQRVKDLLRRMLKRQHVSHAYLFFGREGIGKHALALEFAKTLQCATKTDESCGQCESCRKAEQLAHPDIRLVHALPVGRNEEPGDAPFEKLDQPVIQVIRDELQKKARDPYYSMEIPKAQFIKVNSIREIRRESSRSPVEGRYKIFVVLNAEDMNPESANALLKTLEEPLPNAILLLTTAYRERLLPTILSRCQQVECSPLFVDEIAAALVERDGMSREQALIASELSDGSYADARAQFDESVQAVREQAVQFMRVALGPSHMLLSEQVGQILKDADRAAVERWLSILESWLREAFIVQQAGPERSVRTDDTREKFLVKFPAFRLDEAIGRVEEAIADTRRNVYLPLVLTSLAYQFRSCVPNSRPL